MSQAALRLTCDLSQGLKKYESIWENPRKYMEFEESKTTVSLKFHVTL